MVAAGIEHLAVAMTWQPMDSAPRDGTIIEIKGGGGVKYRARWLAPRGIWIDWERQHVELDPVHAWRPWDGHQYRQWTPEEEQTLAMIHRE